MKDNRTAGEDGKSGRYRSIILWSAVAAGALVGYVFFYPMRLIAMIDWDWFDDAPGWLETMIEGSVVPLDWLHERSSL